MWRALKELAFAQEPVAKASTGSDDGSHAGGTSTAISGGGSCENKSHRRRRRRIKLTFRLDNRPHRRVDIKAYPAHQFPFACLYFTGSDHFNRSMRYYAKQAFQLSLSDKELAPAFYMRVEGVGMQKQHNNGERIPCDSEQQIFDELGLEYKHPFERNCYDVRVEKRKDDDLKAEKRGGGGGGRGR